ncbi:MAG: sulfite exporter TauE/SafE family protein [Candidatus Thorarchaeota archaeon]
MDLLIVVIIPVVIGLISGFGSGLFGIGGGSIRIPLLNLMGLPLISTYGINLFTIPVSCSMGAYTQRENIELRLGSYMIVGGAIGTLLGTVIAFSLSTSALILAVLFVIVSMISVVGMNLRYIIPSVSEKLSPSVPVIAIGAFASNTLGGMRGGSGGSLFGPLLRSLNIEMHRAIATSLFVAAFTSLVGVFLYWSQGQLMLVEGISVLVGSIVGSRLGSLVSIDAKPRWLEISLSIVILGLALSTLLKALLV